MRDEMGGRNSILEEIDLLKNKSTDEMLDERYKKYREIGEFIN